MTEYNAMTKNPTMMETTIETIGKPGYNVTSNILAYMKFGKDGGPG